jgi:beta-lactamase regulating signal transducer with metallopeptidase domain
MDHFSFLFSSTAQALGHTLLYSLWQAFVVFICLRLILKLIPHASARIKYSLSYFAYFGIAAWFVITLIRQLSLVQNELAYHAMIGQDTFERMASDQSVSFSSLGLSFSFLNAYLPWLVGFYLIGTICLAIRLLYNYFQTSQLKSNGLTALDTSWQERILQLAGKINIHRKVSTYFSSHITTPVMIGFFKPLILLPLATMNHLSPQQFEAILLHELAHIRRNDYLWNLFQSVLDIVLFFNPFTWWITKNIREEREKCCDEMVLQLSDPYHYARALLALEEPAHHHALMMTAVGKRSKLLHRIKNIIEMKNNRINLRQKLIASLVIATASISVAWLTPQEDKAVHSGNQVIALNTPPKIPVLSTWFPPLRALTDTPPKKIAPVAPLPPVAPLAPDAPVPPAPPMPPTAPLGIIAPAPPMPPVPPVPPIPPIPPLPPIDNMKDTPPPVANYFKSKEWRQQQEAIKKSTAEMQKYFHSDAWKKQQKLMKKNSLAVSKYFNSPEWKKQQEEIQRSTGHIQEYFNSPEWKKQQEEIQKSTGHIQEYFNSPEWKKQQEEIQKSSDGIQKYFNSPEWKKQQELIKHSTDSIKAYFNSDAWKKQQQDLQKTMAKTKQFFESNEWKKQQDELKRLMDESKDAMENAKPGKK